MMQAGTYNFEVPDVAFVQLTGAGPGLNANVHFIPYTKVATGTLMDTARELFAFAFGTLEVHRLQAWVPVFNGRAIRLAALMHMKFEGELRRAFRYENEWWNVALYALTEDEWRESNASGRNQHTN
jgi:hypothetical protein